MVSRQWLLLALSGVHCSTQQLDIPIAPVGFRAIQQEDIKRDIWAVERQDGYSLSDWWDKRQSQFDVIPLENAKNCVQKKGRNVAPIKGFWIEEDASALELATLIALVKISDGVDLDFDLFFCVGKVKEQNASNIIWSKIEDISGEKVRKEKMTWTSSATRKNHFVDYDFRQVEQNIRQIIREEFPSVAASSNP